MQKTRLLTWVIVLGWPLWLGGCNNDKKPFFQTRSGTDTDTPTAKIWPKPRTSQEQYTLLLHVASNPSGHKQQVLEYKTNTERLTNWKGLYVVHNPDHSELYWDKYAMTKDAVGNLKKAKKFRTPSGLAVYAKSIIVPLPGKDIGPAKWNLVNADGRYTVVIAVFFDVPKEDYYNRREIAVQYCRQLREKGEKAFFHHGISVSRVTIGTFDKSAIRTIRKGRRTRSEIRSQHMQAVVDRYPYLAVNGRQEIRTVLNPKTYTVESLPQRTYPVEIPAREENNYADAFDSSGYPQSW